MQIAKILIFIFFSVPVSCVYGACNLSKDGGNWFDINDFDIKSFNPESPQYSHEWQGWWSYAAGDMEFDSRWHGSKEDFAGNLMLVAGRILSTRETVASSVSAKARTLDKVLFGDTLILAMLQEAFPGGYAGIEQEQSFDISGIKQVPVSVAFRQTMVPTPWKLAGKVSCVAEHLVFELNVDAGTQGAGRHYKVHYEGTLGRRAVKSLDGEISLDGRKNIGVGDQLLVEEDKESPAYDKFEKVKDVRDYLGDNAKIGQPDPLMDYSGIWKKDNCQADLGQYIRPFGTDGLYTVLACIRDKCTNVYLIKKIYIKGNPYYDVVDADKFDLVYPDGYRRRYVRCGKDFKFRY